MKIAIGSDHRGFALKEFLKPAISRLGHKVQDYGCTNTDSVDYPDYALPVARAVATGKVDRGILICSTGIGMNIAANKVQGIRAALCLTEQMAIRSRQHNNANILCLGADLLSPQQARKLVLRWLSTRFARGRHQRRLHKIAAAESSTR